MLHNSKNMINQLAILGLIGNWWLSVSWITLSRCFVHCIKSQV